MNPFIVSINRFERKKNIELAIHAFAEYLKMDNSQKNLKLIIAGNHPFPFF